MDISKLTIQSLHAGYAQKEFSAVEVVQEHLRRIAESNGITHAYLAVREQVVEEAQRIDAHLAEGKVPEGVFGVPLALKDNMLMQGEQATASSKMLGSYVSAYDGTAVKKLREGNALILGKTNLDEFAMGSSTENSAFGVTKNPLDSSRVAGGSSGGSAAAVAASMALGSYGSDTGGSIRQPASFCGVVGLKPTYGSVSRYGLIALASSLDQIGPFAKTVDDARVLFNAVAGKDPLDATTVMRPHSPSKDPKEMVIGIPKEYFGEGISSEVMREIEGTIEAFKKEGFTLKEVSLPHTKYALSVYYIIQPAETSSNLARFDGIRYAELPGMQEFSLSEKYAHQRFEGFGPETKRRVLLGTFVLSSGYYDAYYAKAQKVRRLILNDFDAVFSDVDVLLTPTAPTTAFKIGEKANDPLAMYLSDIFTIPVNLAGIPAISIPTRAAHSKQELPVGMQLMGPRFGEELLFSLGSYYEKHLRP